MSVQRFTFGAFELDPKRLELRRDGIRMNVGARACRVLVALVERSGQVVTQRELLAAGWAGLHVADVNLRVHIVALRKALSGGPDAAYDITTIPREGYVFVGPVSPTGPEKASSTRSGSIPRQLTKLFGRDETLERVGGAMAAHRIVTIVGPGGIGKTALALAAIAEHADRRSEECVFIDFSTSVSSLQVETQLFEALELEGGPNDVPAYIERALSERKILLVLDNCEHVVGHVAGLVASLTSRTAGVSILATSREPLRVPGERVFPLEPLTCPPEGAVLTGQSAMAYAAIQMFAEAAGRRSLTFAVHDANASLLGDVCRRLDGNPLAIELAAATVDTMTISELAHRLDDRFTVLTHGARTALPKHRTLQAALDWSYDGLSADETMVMRCIGVFPGRFSADDAKAIVGAEVLSSAAVHHALANLMAKSLLTVDFGGDKASFRFLETMRVYARLKLLESEETAAIYARFVGHTLSRLTAISRLEREDESRRRYNGILDDWRAAHDWSVRNRDWHAALTLMAEGIAFSQSLNIRLEYVQRATETLRTISPDPQNEDALWLEMRVCDHVAQLLLDTQPLDPPNFIDRIEATASRALELSKRLNAPDYQMSSLVTLAIGALTGANVEKLAAYASGAFDHAERIQDHASIRTAHYLKGYTMYCSSDFAAAVRDCDRALDLAIRANQNASIAFDHVPSVRVVRSRALWVSGEFASGLEEMDEAQHKSLEGGHVPTMAWVAWCGMCIYLWAGFIEKAQAHAKLYERLSSEFRSPGWSRYIPSAHEALELLRDGRRSFDASPIDWTPHALSHADMMTSIHCGFHRPTDLQRIEAVPQHWCAAEHFRAAGEHQLAAGHLMGAERFFLQALATSRSRAAAWEIRATISLARLRVRQQQVLAARTLLEPVFERFPDTNGNADLVYATDILAAC